MTRTARAPRRPRPACYPQRVGTRRKRSWLLALAAVAAIATSFFLAPVRLAALVALGRSPVCTLRRAVQCESHARKLKDAKDRILAASRPIETDAAGYRLWQTPAGRYWIPPNSDYVLPFNLAEQANRIYGTGEQAVQKGDIVLDCGANVGVFVREALRAGARTVVAIEPAPENLECLRRNFVSEIADGRVIVYAKGVWDRDDFLTMHADPGNPAADSFVIERKGSHAVARLPLTTIDKLVHELELSRVDYIKMDIEGAEQRALRGAFETLKKYRPRLSLSTYHRPDDPEKIPSLVRAAWPGYRMECGPCAYVEGRIRPDVLYFR